MAKLGRNDPCHCGSGKKYKSCHLPIEEAAQAEQRRLQAAQDTLLPKLIEAAGAVPEAIPGALQRYWNGKYGVEQLGELAEMEEQGAERFFTWLAFDYPLDDGRTLVERLAAGDGELELTADEARLLAGWTGVRLRPYVAERVLKGQSIEARDLLDESRLRIEDRAASRRVEPGEVLVAHLVPVGDRHFVAGSAAQLTVDTREKLREFAELHLEAFGREQPGAGWADLLRARSEVLNHFVMQLPVEAPDPSVIENILIQTRASLQLAGESIGLVKTPEEKSRDDG